MQKPGMVGAADELDDIHCGVGVRREGIAQVGIEVREA
jgi:hypothetical protein